MSEQRIDVFCDDPRHARGKVANIATFTVDAAAGTVRQVPLGRDRRMQNFRQRAPRAIADAARAGADTPDDFAPHLRRDDWILWTTGTDPIACKLCGRRIEPGVQLSATVLRLARTGVSRIRMSEIASSVDRQERQ